MKVRIFEVGPRDGLQNVSQTVGIETRGEFIKRLIKAGHQDIEVGAFVNPAKIPQMASTSELIKGLPADQKVRYWALVPNEKGFQDFVASGLKHMAVFTAASDTFNQKNINTNIDGSFERLKAFLPEAKKKKISIRGYVSTCFGCPYEGAVKTATVLRVTERLLEMGAQEVSIGDTIGVANPTQVRKLTRALLKIAGPKRFALHFHDTRGTALANILVGLEEGIRTFDSSSGGLGGCPYAPGAAGNVATDDLLYMLDGMNIDTGLNIASQREASLYIQEALGMQLPSRYLGAGPFRPKTNQV